MDGARPIWPRRAGKSEKYKGSLVWIVGVDTAKDSLYSKLRVADPGTGYCHFPIGYEMEYFKQLTSEQVRTKYVKGHPIRYWFKPAGVRNEALDRRVYSMAALYSRLVPWEILARSAPSEPPPESPEGGPTPSGDKPLAAVSHPPQRMDRGRRVRVRFGRR